MGQCCDAQVQPNVVKEIEASHNNSQNKITKATQEKQPGEIVHVTQTYVATPQPQPQQIYVATQPKPQQIYQPKPQQIYVASQPKPQQIHVATQPKPQQITTKKQEITKKEKPQIQKETKALNNEEIEALKMESPEIENILDEIKEDEKLNIAEEKLTYTYSNEGEYKEIGMVWDTYKPRLLKVSVDGIFECYEKKKCRIKIHLLKEPWNDLKTVVSEGKNKKKKPNILWEFKYGGKIHTFASTNPNERTLIMKQFNGFYNKKEAMNKWISSSGKYERDRPNDDDGKEVLITFEQSKSNLYYNKTKKERYKYAKKYWYTFKKDPYWKCDLYLLKEKHGVSNAVIKRQLQIMKEKEEQEKNLLIKIQNKAQEFAQDQMDGFMTQMAILSRVMKKAGFKVSKVKMTVGIPPALKCTIKSVNDKKRWNYDDSENDSQLTKLGRLLLWALKNGDKVRQQLEGTPLMFKSFDFVVSFPPKININFEARPAGSFGGGDEDEKDSEGDDDDDDDDEDSD